MGKSVLILTPHFGNPGGAETFTDLLCKEASKWFNITLLTFQPFQKREPSYQETYKRRGSLKIYRISWLIRPSSVWAGTGLRNLLCTLPQLLIWGIIRCSRKKFDAVHAQGLIAGAVAVILRRFFNVRSKVFITLLALYSFNQRPNWFNSIAKFILKNCDIIFVEGKGGEQDIEGFEIPAEKIRRFQHWVGEEFKPPKTRLNDKIRVLFIGRPIKEKGRHIVEAAERILNNSKYEFHYVDNVPHEELPRYYQMAHVVCVPSLYAEGFSRVVAEGASCGCAVITSDRGSLPEMVIGYGRAVEPTAEDFAVEIQGLKENEDWRKAAQGAALIFSRKIFGPHNADVFIDEYAIA